MVATVDDAVVLIQDDELDVSDSDSTAGYQEDSDNEDFNEISVPLTVVLSVIGGYIVFGTVLFGLWEGWNTGLDMCLEHGSGNSSFFNTTLGGLEHWTRYVPGTWRW